MSIATRTGDDGTTALLFNHRVPKNHPRIAANGALDELNAALGVARAWTGDTITQSAILAVQKHLVHAMGEIAVLPEDRERYVAQGFVPLSGECVRELDAVVSDLETNHQISYRHWATPGATRESAFLDVARTVCRRAEREILTAAAALVEPNPLLLPFLNRLSDVLWLLARHVETQAGV